MSRAAPVAVSDLAIAGDRIVGYAAPAAGLTPCTLLLEADGETIAISHATCFSKMAADRGVRMGWCGVTLRGLEPAAALDDRFVVRCANSGVALLDAQTPTPAPPRAMSPLSVHDILARAHDAGTCEDIVAILPFAEATLRRHGLAAMLDAAYRTLLDRAADAPVVADWVAPPPPDPARAALIAITGAAEFRDYGRRAIPGPFHPRFAFDRCPLEG